MTSNPSRTDRGPIPIMIIDWQDCLHKFNIGTGGTHRIQLRFYIDDPASLPTFCAGNPACLVPTNSFGGMPPAVRTGLGPVHLHV